MLDIKTIREHTEEVKRSLLKRLKPDQFDLDHIIALDDERKKLLTQVEALKAEKNKNSKTKPTPEVIAKMKEIGEKIEMLDGRVKDTQEDLKKQLSALPNMVADDVAAGGKENNQVLRQF